MQHSDMLESLIIVNLPHPKGFMRELSSNPEQKANSEYARRFQKSGKEPHININRNFERTAPVKLTPESLAQMVVSDKETQDRYLQAFKLSSINSMMNYYRQNYPREPYQAITTEVPKIAAPVLQFHGLLDKALLHQALSGTWEWVEKDYTLVALPSAGHWSHHDEAELVSKTMNQWRLQRMSK